MRAPIALLTLALVACSSPGPSTWPTQRQAARTARKARLDSIPGWARLVVDALNDGDTAPIESTLAFRFRAGEPGERLARASERLIAEFGQPVGVVESRVHVEGKREWFTALVLHREGRKKRLVLYQFGRDGDALARLLVREHVFREAIEHPAEDYLAVNRFRFPSDETWTITQGGRNLEDNKHYDHYTQRFAYDVVVKKSGRSRAGGPKRNEAYHAYGKPLFAPAPGRVVYVRDGVPDNVGDERGKGGGNGVIIDHGFGEFSSLWHMVPGSVRVKKGQRVEWGQPLGRVGNTGRSTSPHIHFHVSSGPPETNQVALPAEFSDVFVDGKFRRSVMPAKRARVRASPTPQPGEPRQHPAILIDW